MQGVARFGFVGCIASLLCTAWTGAITPQTEYHSVAQSGLLEEQEGALSGTQESGFTAGTSSADLHRHQVGPQRSRAFIR
jgi:hypothetical protein